MANVGTAAAGKTLVGAGIGSSPTYVDIGTNSGLAAHGLVVAEGNSAFISLGAATNGQIPIGSTGANPVLAALTAGTGVSITNGAGSIVINAVGAGLAWHAVSINTAMAVNNGYIAISPGGALTFSLPAVSAVGDALALTVDGATSFTVTQGAGQSIRLGNATTTAGVGGSMTSTQQGDALTLVCSVANLKWNVVSSMGNPTLV